MTEKEKEKLTVDLAKCLVKAVNQLNEFGKQIAEDPLTRDCCACVYQFRCADEEDNTPCCFKWTFFEEAKYLVEKVKKEDKNNA